MKTWMRNLAVVGICLFGVINCSKDKSTLHGFSNLPVHMICTAGPSVYTVDIHLSQQFGSGWGTATVEEYGSSFVGPPTPLDCEYFNDATYINILGCGFDQNAEYQLSVAQVYNQTMATLYTYTSGQVQLFCDYAN